VEWSVHLAYLLGSKKPGTPSGPEAGPSLSRIAGVRDQWLCPYKSTGVLEYWSGDLKKRALNFQIFYRDLFSESDQKMLEN
jgi:hypothetical protein